VSASQHPGSAEVERARSHPGFAEVALDLVQLYRPDEPTAEKLDHVRLLFAGLIDDLDGLVPTGPDATLAARSVHRACQDVVFAIVHRQG
jgi:hypothetical protein